MTMELTAKNMQLDERRARAVSLAEGGVVGNLAGFSKADDIEYCCAGIPGKYSGEINGEGKPPGCGSFVRDNGGLTYVGSWSNGERVGNGGYYTTAGRLLGNVVWD